MSALVISGDTSGAITLQSPAVAGTNTVNFGANTGTAILDANTPAFRNRIINGAMVIDQRNAGASFTPSTASNYGTCDRWSTDVAQNSKLTVQQSTTAPTGFSNSLVFTSSSAYSVLATDYFMFDQRIEGFNTADFGWGTASASTVTLSFWVRSSLTGTFGGSFTNNNENRSYPFTYTINSANTFEQKTITVAGDTSGTWVGASNSAGIKLWFSLGVGSGNSGTANAWQAGSKFAPTGAVSVVGTNGATFYITGVQLEKGSTATSFDYRPYSTELNLCYRYYWLSNGAVNTTDPSFGTGISVSTTLAFVTITNPVTMRSAPTLTYSGTFNFRSVTSLTVSAISLNTAGTDSTNLSVTTAVNTAGFAGILRNGNSGTAAVLAFSSEL